MLMSRFFKRMRRMSKTEELVEEHQREHREEMQKTTKAVQRAEKLIKNGVTIKIYKAVHHGH